MALSGLYKLTRVIAAAIAVSLSAHPGNAQQGAFADLSGSWIGNGTVTLSSASHEHIRCRATYGVGAGDNNLQLALRCASDSYKFDFRVMANDSNGNITGSWFETTQHAAGQLTGHINGNHINGRIEGQTFAALLDMTTRGNQQSISIRSPGSPISDVTIALRRR